ncbi:MAG TPA: S41 family peptidase [Saprospiraceae bacterium]|nr:S41 family peptidase [Saprospiraceae bacterium]
MKKAITKYWLLPIMFLTLSIPVIGQQFNNLGFQQLCDTSKTGLCYWDLSWGGKGSVKPDTVDKNNCLLIRGKSENSVGFVEQTTFVDDLKTISIITISAIIKSDSIVGKGSGLNIGLYDSDGLLIANKDMGGFYSLDWIRGTTEWKNYTISIVCPTETSKIKIGAILYGKGKVWFKDYKVSITSIQSRRPNKLAKAFIKSACDTIQKNSLYRDSVNFKQIKRVALKIAGPAKNYTDCYLAVNYMLESLRPFGDKHSFFMTAEEVKNWENEGSQVSKIQFPTFEVVDSCGYILVPPFHGGNPKQMLAYADTLQAAIQTLYNLGIKGWLIDLTQNTGGNMAPMIAGLGPLFSSEKLGSLIDVNGKSNAWYYKKGRYFWDDDIGWNVSAPVQLPTSLPIAVLTGNQTGSSGEAVVVSFIGNKKTKSFGQPTWGLTTGNGSFELKDGSQIFLASTIMSDRNGKEYRSSITPDFKVDITDSKILIDAAVQWIMSNYK